MQFIEAVDTHTGGEPTRVVFSGGPDLGGGTMAQRRERLASDADWLRRALILEPRGSDWMVGALVQPPVDPDAAAGLIFFNNTGYLGMCGHGLIGVVAALAYRGTLTAGTHRFETPVGDVAAELRADDSVSIQNVESYRFRTAVDLTVPGLGKVTGDIAYGGNWFFLVATPDLDRFSIPELLDRCQRISDALKDEGIGGLDGAEIDHIELCGPPADANTADGRNFVLCPGGQYDRSPCGTGTSAKLACLAASGKLRPGDIWRQDSIIGSRFLGSYEPAENGIHPTIQGRAHVVADVRFVIDPEDPFGLGIGGDPPTGALTFEPRRGAVDHA